MSQLLETTCLTKEQIQTVLNNLWTIRNIKMDEVIYEGKPSFSKDVIDKYHYKVYTKFADNYVIYKCKSLEDNHDEIYITVETDHYDKQNILAISGFEHMLVNYLEPSCVYDRPTINICLCFVITNTMKQHIPPEIFAANCHSRIYSLCSLYPLIGSKTTLYAGLTYDYKLLKHDGTTTAYNNKEFSIVYANDPIAIILNAVENDIVCYKRIVHDTNVYSEWQLRIVKNKLSSLSSVSKSGVPPPIPQSRLVIN